MRPPRFGFDSVGAAISRPRAHDMRPYISAPARSTPCACPVWVCFVGAAISRPRTYGMRPYASFHCKGIYQLAAIVSTRTYPPIICWAGWTSPAPLNDEKKEGTL